MQHKSLLRTTIDMIKKEVKVIQLIYNFEIEGGGGGITRFAVELSKCISKYVSISIISLGDFGSPFESQRIKTLNDFGIESYVPIKWNKDNPYKSFLRSYERIKDYLSGTNTKLILHSHSEFTDIVALFLKIQKKVNYIIRTCHYGYKHEWKNKPIRRILFTNLLYPIYYNYEIGVNKSIRQRLDNRFLAKILKKKSLLIPEAINLNDYSNSQINNVQKIYKKKLGIAKDTFIIGSVGRLTEQKGHKYLLMAAQKIAKENSNVHFMLVGDGPLRPDLEALSNQLGIKHFVSFLGRRSDIKELLQCFDIFVLPSLWEGLPISLLESMASKVPIVTTSIAGCTDIIENGKNGILVPPRDPQSLYEALMELMKSQSKRIFLSNNAYNTVQKFSIDNVANLYHEIYFSL